MSFLIVCLVGTLGGVLGWLTKMPSGILIGSMGAVLAYKLISASGVVLPGGFNFVAQIMLGIMLGMSVQRDMLGELVKVAWPLFLSVLLLVGAGVMIAVLLTRLGWMDAQTAYLSTSPGGMTAMVVIALEQQVSAPTVVVFHFMRLMFVIFTAPFLVKLMKFFSGTGD